ncbi:MAG: hypothetical protein K8T90_09255 [Planctomycetes bacterium]|nr:hypothetical protein [Planctomycetota bacterium]
MNRRILVLAAAPAVLLASSFLPTPARADEASADRVWDDLSGEIRAGWRFLRGEEEGRFFQDRSLQDGPRIFDAVLRGDASKDDAALSSFDLSAHGIGDEESDYRLRASRRGMWTLDSGYSRDDYSYRSTGDPFPYDTIRERSSTHLRYTPSTRLTVRLDWDRSLRRGDSYVGQDTDIRELPAPPGVDADIVQSHRPLRQQSDRVTLGVDAAFDGGLRFSLAETLHLAQVDDTRLYDIPAANRTAIPVREALRREVRSPAWTTVAKGAWSAPGGAFDMTGIFSWTTQPTDSRVAGTSHGYDGSYDPAGVSPRGEYSETTGGGNEVDRKAINARGEAVWRPHRDWEITGALEDETIVDDASLRLTQTRDWVRPDLTPETTRRAYDARITDRLWRASVDGEWQATETVRLRLGEEFLRESLAVPTDTRQADFGPTAFDSNSWRTTVGADWDPSKVYSFSLLVRRGTNDEPHAATSSDTADEVSYRGRWKASDTFSLSTVWRHKGYQHDSVLDSASRSDSFSVGGAWTSGAFTFTPSVTWQIVDTRTDTTFFELNSTGFQKIRDQVAFSSRNLIVNLDARYDFAKNLRGFATLSFIDSGGDYSARWDELTIGAEHDIRKDLSVGASLKSWRLDESGSSADDYTTQGAEVWLTYRF